MPRGQTAEERFADKVKCQGDHWIWDGSLSGKGRYGTFQYEGKVQKAHRASYKMFVGPLTDDEEVHHKCRVKQCVAPWHLERTDHPGNMAYEVKSRCKNDHDMAKVGRSKSGNCRACMKDYLREYHRRGKG